MSTSDFAAVTGKPYKTVDELALEGLQMYARKKIAQGQGNELAMVAKKSFIVPTELPSDLGENRKNEAALWAILGSDAKDDKFVGPSGPVGIAHLMTWAMEEGRVEDVKSFLPWALYNTKHHDQQRIFCEAMKHPETVEIIKPVASGIFYELVYPTHRFNEVSPEKSSSGFIPFVRSAAQYPELHPMIDEVLPAALERELSWCPQNFASLALARYEKGGDFTPVHTLATQMVDQNATKLPELANPSCVTLIKRMQESGDKAAKDAARRFSGIVFERTEDSDFLDATECMLVAVNEEGNVDILSRDTDWKVTHESVAKGQIYSRNYSGSTDGYATALDLLGNLADLPFRKISDAAKGAAKVIRREINTRPGLYAGMDETYRARYAPIIQPQGQRFG